MCATAARGDPYTDAVARSNFTAGGSVCNLALPPGEIEQPMGVAIGGGGELLLADSHAGELLAINVSQARVAKRWGGLGYAYDGKRHPQAPALIAVADGRSGCVRFVVDERFGAPRARPQPYCGARRPTALAFEASPMSSVPPLLAVTDAGRGAPGVHLLYPTRFRAFEGPRVYTPRLDAPPTARDASAYTGTTAAGANNRTHPQELIVDTPGGNATVHNDTHNETVIVLTSSQMVAPMGVAFLPASADSWVDAKDVFTSRVVVTDWGADSIFVFEVMTGRAPRLRRPRHVFGSRLLHIIPRAAGVGPFGVSALRADSFLVAEKGTATVSLFNLTALRETTILGNPLSLRDKEYRAQHTESSCGLHLSALWSVAYSPDIGALWITEADTGRVRVASLASLTAPVDGVGCGQAPAVQDCFNVTVQRTSPRRNVSAVSPTSGCPASDASQASSPNGGERAMELASIPLQEGNFTATDAGNDTAADYVRFMQTYSVDPSTVVTTRVYTTFGLPLPRKGFSARDLLAPPPSVQLHFSFVYWNNASDPRPHKNATGAQNSSNATQAAPQSSATGAQNSSNATQAAPQTNATGSQNSSNVTQATIAQNSSNATQAAADAADADPFSGLAAALQERLANLGIVSASVRAKEGGGYRLSMHVKITEGYIDEQKAKIALGVSMPFGTPAKVAEERRALIARQLETFDRGFQFVAEYAARSALVDAVDAVHMSMLKGVRRLVLEAATMTVAEASLFPDPGQFDPVYVLHGKPYQVPDLLLQMQQRTPLPNLTAAIGPAPVTTDRARFFPPELAQVAAYVQEASENSTQAVFELRYGSVDPTSGLILLVTEATTTQSEPGMIGQDLVRAIVDNATSLVSDEFVADLVSSIKNVTEREFAVRTDVDRLNADATTEPPEETTTQSTTTAPETTPPPRFELQNASQVETTFEVDLFLGDKYEDSMFEPLSPSLSMALDVGSSDIEGMIAAIRAGLSNESCLTSYSGYDVTDESGDPMYFVSVSLTNVSGARLAASRDIVASRVTPPAWLSDQQIAEFHAHVRSLIEATPETFLEVRMLALQAIASEVVQSAKSSGKGRIHWIPMIQPSIWRPVALPQPYASPPPADSVHAMVVSYMRTQEAQRSFSVMLSSQQSMQSAPVEVLPQIPEALRSVQRVLEDLSLSLGSARFSVHGVREDNATGNLVVILDASASKEVLGNLDKGVAGEHADMFAQSIQDAFAHDNGTRVVTVSAEQTVRDFQTYVQVPETTPPPPPPTTPAPRTTPAPLLANPVVAATVTVPLQVQGLRSAIQLADEVNSPSFRLNATLQTSLRPERIEAILNEELGVTGLGVLEVQLGTRRLLEAATGGDVIHVVISGSSRTVDILGAEIALAHVVADLLGLSMDDLDAQASLVKYLRTTERGRMLLRQATLSSVANAILVALDLKVAEIPVQVTALERTITVSTVDDQVCPTHTRAAG